MKRNGKNQKMPKGAMAITLNEKGEQVATPLTSDIWSRMTNTQRRDLLNKYKKEQKADMLARVEANKAKKKSE